MTSILKLRWWLLFGLGLLVAMTGWMWIMVRLVRSESEAAGTRVRQAEERLLIAKADELSSKAKRMPAMLMLVEVTERDLSSAIGVSEALESSIPNLARSGTCAGWWHPLPYQEPPLVDSERRVTRVWRSRIRDGEATAVDLRNALDERELRWGWIEGGRDLVAGFLPSLYRKGDRSEELVAMLEERVWNFDSPTVSPGFRLTLIRPLLEMKPSDELRRLLEIETIRAAEGRTGATGKDYEVIATNLKGEAVLTFWSKSQLLALLDVPDDYELYAHAPEDRASAPVEGLRRWPYLAARTTLVSRAADAGGRSLIWIGGASGLALLALAATAVFVGRHQLRVARMRTDLAASVAHELRTPLAGQRLLLETLIEKRLRTEAEREEYVAMAFRENKRLSRLAEEFLTFSRLERGVLQLDIGPVDLCEVIDGAVESLREKWDDPGCRLSIEIGGDLPPVAGDSQALVTVLRNLLENAWKYSENPRRIGIRATADGDDVLIAVSDNGIGLPAGERQRIFRQYYRVDRRLARSEDGLGLGLSIVRRLLESMHGNIGVTGNGDAGSTFTVRIPKAS